MRRVLTRRARTVSGPTGLCGVSDGAGDAGDGGPVAGGMPGDTGDTAPGDPVPGDTAGGCDETSCDGMSVVCGGAVVATCGGGERCLPAVGCVDLCAASAEVRGNLGCGF